MSWNIVSDIVAGVNGLGQYIVGLPEILINHLINLLTLILYPVYSTVTILEYDLNYIYSSFSELINIFYQIASIPSMILSTVIILPDAWTSLLLMSISISVSIRVYRWVREIISWLPTMNQGGA